MDEQLPSQPVPQPQAPEPIKDFELPLPKLGISLKVVLFLIPIVVAAIFGFIYYMKVSVENIQARNIHVKKSTDDPSVVVVPQTIWQNFEDVQMNLFLKYPSNSEVSVKDDETEARSLIIVHKGQKQTTPVNSETDLQDGYFVLIRLNKNPESMNTEMLSSRKKESYNFVCEQGYSVDNVVSTEIDTAKGFTFNISNCPQNIHHTFISFGDRLYEIIGASRGDIGYKESYDQDLGTILNSISFLNKNVTDNTAGIKYTNPAYGFSLEHPLLDTRCCDIDLTVFQKASKVVVLGNKTSFEKSNGKDFTGIAIYAWSGIKDEANSYIESQKNLLVTDYKIITGKNPQVSEEKITIDGVEGTLLKGYAWWGDVIFIQHPTRNNLLIISKLVTKDDDFDTEFKEILKTFKFE